MSTRRDFLKFMGAAVASLALPRIPLPSESITVQDQLLTIDSETRMIGYKGPPITIRDLYSMLQDEFDNPERMIDPAPMTAITPNMFEMNNEWRIDENSIQNLKDGSLNQYGDVFACVVVLGEFDPKVAARIPIEANGATQMSGPAISQPHEMLKIPQGKGTLDLKFQDRYEILPKYECTLGHYERQSPGIIYVPTPYYAVPIKYL